MNKEINLDPDIAIIALSAILTLVFGYILFRDGTPTNTATVLCLAAPGMGVFSLVFTILTLRSVNRKRTRIRIRNLVIAAIAPILAILLINPVAAILPAVGFLIVAGIVSKLFTGSSQDRSFRPGEGPKYLDDL